MPADMPSENELIEGGYQLWARNTLESAVFVDKPAEWFKLWFFLVMRVHWSDDKKLPRGSIHLRYDWIEDNLRLSKSTIDHFMRWAKGQRMLATAKATRGMVITLLNYAKYQDPGNYKSDSKSELKATQKRHRSDTITKEREEREERKEEYRGEAISSPTPADEARGFFEDAEKQNAFIQLLGDRGIGELAARQEVNKFIAYWTERNSTGKKERWQMEKVFDIRRRLANWFSRSKDFKSKPKIFIAD
jgi:hypothetical protein